MAGGEEIPRYPPFLRGLPAAAAAQILATQHELVVALQNALAFTDRRARRRRGPGEYLGRPLL